MLWSISYYKYIYIYIYIYILYINIYIYYLLNNIYIIYTNFAILFFLIFYFCLDLYFANILCILKLFVKLLFHI